MLKKTLCSLLLLSIVPVVAYATPKNTPALVSEPIIDAGQSALLNFTNKVKSAQGTFTQIREGGKLEKGVFSFKRPGRFLWHVNSPFEQINSSDGTSIYQYDPDLAQLSVRPVHLGTDQSPARILFGDGAIDQGHFVFESLPKSKGLVWVRAIPKVEDQGVRYVDIGFKGDTLSRLVLRDSFNKTVEVQFFDIKTNVILPDSEFKVNVDESVDVLYLN